MMDVEDNKPVTHWVSALKAGDQDAAKALWDCYFDRMVRLADVRLRAARGHAGVEDGEDAALSAFNSFCDGTRRGSYARLANRHNVWWLLATITARKTGDQIERGRALKRGAARTVSKPVRLPGDSGAGTDSIEQVASALPGPDRAAIGIEECRRLLEQLGDTNLRRIARWRMEGYTALEIAGLLGCSLRTVNYRITRIREVLAAALSA
jgi:DNA-directed RNA polymerase specialized sigma24 family protein